MDSKGGRGVSEKSTNVHQGGWGGLFRVHVDCKAAKIRHMKAHKSTNIDAEVDFTNVSDEFNSDSDTEIKENSGPMPVFEDLKNHVVSPFVQLTDEFMDLE